MLSFYSSYRIDVACQCIKAKLLILAQLFLFDRIVVSGYDNQRECAWLHNGQLSAIDCHMADRHGSIATRSICTHRM